MRLPAIGWLCVGMGNDKVGTTLVSLCYRWLCVEMGNDKVGSNTPKSMLWVAFVLDGE